MILERAGSREEDDREAIRSVRHVLREPNQDERRQREQRSAAYHYVYQTGDEPGE